MRKYIFIIFLLASWQFTLAQNNACPIRISVLTCAPADELYATFGHTAIRIIDSANRTDIVFNYGTFNFDDPDFYTKFIRGRLDYFLSIEQYKDFLIQYIEDKRSIYEQELNLTCLQKQQIINALSTNLQGANRYYKYDFLFDNCTTRIRDIVFKNITAATIPNAITAKGTTYRNMLHEYLDKGGKPWSKLGIDILLGSKTDEKVTTQQAMFLPDYLLKGLDSALLKKDTAHLVLNKQLILQETPPNTAAYQYTPLLISSIISILIILISFVQLGWAKITTQLIDSFLLYITGIIGILLLFMWFATDHIVCTNNFNLCWALPTNFFAAFFIWKKPTFIKKYFLIAAVITALLLVSWLIIPQQLNIALFPLALAGLIRYIKLYQA